MNSVATGLVLIPGAVALLVLLVFTYLYEQNRHTYFRAWQLAWAAYTLHYALKAVEYFQGPSPRLPLLSSFLLVGIATSSPKRGMRKGPEKIPPPLARSAADIRPQIGQGHDCNP